MNSNEYIQVFSIALTIILGAAPNFIDLKRNNDSQTKQTKSSLTTFGFIVLIGFVISFVFAVWSTISNINDNIENKKNLKSIILKADLASQQLDSVVTSSRVISDSLSLINIKSSQLGTKMRNLLAVQQNINEASSFLIDDIHKERRGIIESNRNKLKSSIDQLGSSYRRIWLQGASLNIQKEDSLRRLGQYINYTIYTIFLLKSQSQNPELLKNKNLSKFWSYILGKIKKIQFTLYGYGLTSLSKEFNELFDISRLLSDMADSYEKEPYFIKLNIDTNLYPIPIRK